jgi:cytochrome c
MNEAEFNRTALAALGSIVFVMVLVAFSNLVMGPQRAAVPGYPLPTSAASTEKAAAPAAAPEVPLPELLAKADTKKGMQDAKVCTTCHNFEKGAPAKIGPPLWDVVGRPIASYPGFSFSDSLKSVGGDWTYEKLYHWIANPRAMASGTKMAFPGEHEPVKDADILAYLQTLSDKPVPFPK